MAIFHCYVSSPEGTRSPHKNGMYHPIELMAIEIFQPGNHFSKRLNV